MLPRRVVILAFDGCQLLDVAGPASVLAAATDVPGTRGYRVALASPGGGMVSTGAGIDVATVLYSSIPAQDVDLLLVAGGTRAGMSRFAEDRAMADWARTTAAAAERYGSICTGAFALAAWGLCEGCRVATHWGSAAELARTHDNVEVDPVPLFIEDGRLWTSAGVTTGIDMTLAIVARDEGEATAATVARRLVLPLRRAGGQAQYSSALEAQAGAAGRYATLIAWLAEHIEQPVDVAAMAARAGESVRSFQRGFRASTGTSPAAFVAKLRLERARELLGAGRTVKEAARASGYATPERLSRAISAAYGLPASTLRSRKLSN